MLALGIQNLLSKKYFLKTKDIMNIELFSLTVASTAIVISAFMQYVTLKMMRKNTLSNLKASAVDSMLAGLRKTLAKYLNLTYTIDRNFNANKFNEVPFPSDHEEVMMREDRLFNLIRLYLRPDNNNHKKLLEAIEHLRNLEDDDIWISKRDNVVSKAVKMFSVEQQKLFKV